MIVAAALTFFKEDGTVDATVNRCYAEELAARVDEVVLFGGTGEGRALSAPERDDLLEVWLDVLHPQSITAVAADVGPEGAEALLSKGVKPMHPPWPASSMDTFVDYHRRLKGKVMVYSHPGRSPLPFTAIVAETLLASDALPAGAKVSKAGLDEVTALRRALADKLFTIWHGTDRHIRHSLMAGADAVVSQAAGALAVSSPSLDCAQAEVDALRGSLKPGTKLRELKQRAISAIGGGGGTDVVRAP